MAFECPVCNKHFEQKSNLIRHKKKHEGKVYTCEICLKQFNDQSNLKKHVKGVHIKLADHKCGLCDAVFKQKTHLQSHQLTHTHVKEFTCGVCGKEFSRKKVLETHMRTHTEDKVFQCSICSEAFNHKSSLEFHMGKHTGIPGFTCEYCGRKFDRKANFQRHTFIHLDKKPFNCEICSRGFIQRSLLDSHMQKYHPLKQNGESSVCLKGTPNSARNPPKESYIFRCTKCDKKFNAKGNLNRHVRAVHEQQSEQFVCKVCMNAYISKQFLDMHMKTEHVWNISKLTESGLEDMTGEADTSAVAMDTEHAAERDNLNALQMVYSSVNIEKLVESNEAQNCR